MENKFSILLVEDNPGDVRLIIEMLRESEKVKFDISNAGRLDESLKLLDEGNFEVVLLDLGLPDSQGLDTFRKVRSHVSQIPIVILTGLADIDTALRAIQEGAQDFLTKSEMSSSLLVRVLRYSIERKRTEERLKHLNLVLQAIRSVNQLIVTEKDRDRLIRKVCEKLIETRGYHNAWIVLFNRSGEYKTSAEAGLGENLKPMLELLNRGESTRCGREALEQPEVVVIKDTHSECADCPLAKEYLDRGGMTTRLEHSGRIYGTLTVSTAVRFIDDEDEEEPGLIKEVANDIALALYSIEKEEEEKKVEAKLRESFEIINRSPTVAFLWKNAENWPVEYVSENVKKLFGYTAEDFLTGKVPYSKTIHPDDLKRVGEEVARYSRDKKRTEFIHDPYRIITQDGQVKWIDDRTSTRRDENGNITHYQGIVLDITERMQVEEEIKKLAMIAEQAAEGIAVADLDGTMQYANKAWAEMHGYPTPDELIGKHLSMFHSEEQLQKEVIAFNKEVKRKGHHRGEVGHMRSDGKTFPTEMTTTLFRDKSGKPIGLIGFATDITNRKQAEEALRQSEERYRTVFERAGDYVLMLDVEQGEIPVIMDANEAALSTHGYERDEIIGKPITLLDKEMTPEMLLERKELIETKGGGVISARHHRKDGTEFDVEANIQLVQIGEKHVLLSIERDVTEQKRSAEAMLESEERYRTLFEQAGDAIVLENENEEIINFSNRTCELFGYTREELLTMKTSDLQEESYGRLQIYNNPDQSIEMPIIRNALRKDGTRIILELTVVPLKTSRQKLFISIVRDVTERKKTENALRTSQAQLSTALKIAQLGPWEYDVENDLFIFNDAFYAIFRTTAEEVGGYTMSSADYAKRFVHPEDIQVVGEEIRFAIESTDPTIDRQLEHRIIYADDEVGYITVRFFIVKDGQGKTIRTYGVNQDITRRKRIEDELRENQRMITTLLENLPGMAYHCLNDEHWTMKFVSEAVKPLTGYEVEDVLDNKLISFEEIMHPEDREQIRRAVQEAVKTRQAFQLEYRIIRKDGEVNWVWERGIGVNYRNGTAEFIEGFIINITEQKKAEEALRESEGKFRKLIEHSNDAIYLLYENRFEIVNKQFLEIHGCRLEDINKPDFNLMDFIAPASRPMIEERATMITQGITPPPRYEFTIVNKEGHHIEVEASVTQIPYRDGYATLGILRDATERKSLEDQLRQSQKMEGIGRLAGGVAHDFNNLLTVISGHTDLLSLSLDSHDPLLEDIKQVRDASDRAADLTRQLLAFSRKQTLQPRVLNLNSLINNLHKMLKRIIREDIDLEIILAENLWNVKVDPGQIDQVIINLSVNARDAMPDGGKLTIETQNVDLDKDYLSTHPGSVSGQYVMLAISDTGSGMPEDVCKQIFEPFYTTKGEGKGTGLGLSTVYGIVKQSGGNINVYSEVGSGTSFKIYLPRVESEEETYRSETGLIELPRGTETIMIVEDEPGVRKFAVRVLKQQGYKIIEAENGGEAFMISKELDKPVDLLLTDVIMPHMGGAVLAKNLREMWPDLKILYMSGYTANAIAHSGFLDPDKPYIQKPFRPIDLAWKVRRVLDEKQKS